MRHLPLALIVGVAVIALQPLFAFLGIRLFFVGPPCLLDRVLLGVFSVIAVFAFVRVCVLIKRRDFDRSLLSKLCVFAAIELAVGPALALNLYDCCAQPVTFKRKDGTTVSLTADQVARKVLFKTSIGEIYRLFWDHKP